MAKPYSYDLPQKVIQAIKLDSMKKSEAAQVFQISRNTVACLRGEAFSAKLPYRPGAEAAG